MKLGEANLLIILHQVGPKRISGTCFFVGLLACSIYAKILLRIKQLEIKNRPFFNKSVYKISVVVDS